MNREEIEKHLLKAENKLEAAKTNLNYSQYDDVVSRAYYSTFHAISAILLTKDLSHSRLSVVLIRSSSKQIFFLKSLGNGRINYLNLEKLGIMILMQL